MKHVASRSLLPWLALVFGLARALVADHQPDPDRYWLEFDGPDLVLGGRSGDVVQADYGCTLTHRGDGDGAAGWTLVVTGAGATVESITIAGTDAERLLREDGFQSSGLLDWDGVAAAFSSVVLSSSRTVTLPPRQTHLVARVEFAIAIPAGEAVSTLAFADSPVGAEPLANSVLHEGQTRLAFKDVRPIRVIEEPDCCGAPLALGFSAESIRDAARFEGVVDAGGGCRGAGGELVFSGGGAVYANATSLLGEDVGGLQGWSIVVAMEGEAEVVAATTEGTAAALAPDGSRDEIGFESTTVLSGEQRFGGVRGAVSAVVLSFVTPVTLPRLGTESILKLGVEPSGPLVPEERTASLRFMDNLGGTGQPVDTRFTAGGRTHEACNTYFAGLTLVFASSPEFVRGDCNDDRNVNVADASCVLGFLFLGAPEPPCAVAADANGDAALDIGDASALLTFLFLGGSPPPAPFPDCGPGHGGLLDCQTTGCR